MKSGFKFTSFLDDTINDIEKGEIRVLRKAVSPLTKKIRSNIKAMDLVKKGDLLKGAAKLDIYQHAVLVGMAPPAFHALLVELGHTAPNGRVIAGQSYFLTAFNSTYAQVQDNLSNDWIR